ncbi:MAG: N-acetyltransferase [Kordiimonadaceae bacterium]|nr:N-acetyltransferase [Kordiimonadaceae bacterium]
MLNIRPYTHADWPTVEHIMQEGIDTGVATFETVPQSQQKWETESIETTQLVAVDTDDVCGWVVLWPVSDRCAYAGVAEISVYVSARSQGKSVGKRLVEAVIERSEKLGIWTIQAGIFEDNPGSIALHKACGFRQLGYKERIGKLRGVWRNTLQFERRSIVVGIE